MPWSRSGRRISRISATCDAEMSPEYPVPRDNADAREYWRAATDGRLLLRRCAACHALHFPPRHLCPRCWSDQLTWVEASGRGTVHTFTIMRRAPVSAFVPRLPYVVALIDLVEGPRMMSNIIGDDALEVRIGDAVELCFEARGSAALPQFKRAHGRCD
jgi:uncharacterized protein